MKILHVASEIFPLVKTGGLADVLGALPLAQQANGDDVRVLIPYYPQVQEKISQVSVVAKKNSFAGELTLLYTEYAGLKLYLIDAPHLFARHGNPYHDEHYQDYFDNVYRFAILGWVGAQLANGLDSWWQNVDILHAHDWQAGLALAYLKYWQTNTKTVFTIHNIAYQGNFSNHHLPHLDLPWTMYNMEGLEFHGQISFLKAGLYYADRITTVSPTYADEITHQPASNGLEGLLSTRHHQGRLTGILNGVDDSIWQPATDTYLIANYDCEHLEAKQRNKQTMQEKFGLEMTRGVPLLVMVARLTVQKGADILAQSIENYLDNGILPFQFILLGSGAPELENWYHHLNERDSQNIGVHIGYDEALSHQLIAAGDAILVPSRFEPCGLTQLYGLKYGSLPIVRKTGGLADTVNHSNVSTIRNHTATGFVFDEPQSDALTDVLNRMLKIWREPEKWARVRENAMQQDFGWHKAASEYAQVYGSSI